LGNPWATAVLGYLFYVSERKQTNLPYVSEPEQADDRLRSKARGSGRLALGSVMGDS